MADINRVILVGRLTRDAELRYTGGGMAVCKFAVAVNRRRKNGDRWEDEASFFDVALFGKQGEAVSRYLVKGKQVGIDGELRQSRWEQDGQPRSRVEIAAFNLQLLGGTGGGPGGGAPQRSAGPSSAQQGGEPAAGAFDHPSDDTGGEFEDDIPF